MKDSDAGTSASTITATNNCIDMNGNTKWKFTPKHTALVVNYASPSGKADNGARVPILKITVNAINDMELQSLNVHLVDGTGMSNLSTSQVKALFANILLVKDNNIHDQNNTYQTAFDTTILKTVANADISVSSGSLIMTNFTSSTVLSGPGSVFFLVGEIKAGANAASPNNFLASVNAVKDLIVGNAGTHAAEPLNYTVNVSSTALTAITPAAAPGGSSYPAALSGEALSAPAAYNRVTENTYYIGGSSGKLYSLNADGSTRWPAPFDTGSPITSAPQVVVEGGNTYIYAANDAGTIFKIQDMGSSGTTAWTLALGAVVKSEPIIDRVNNAMYVGAAQKLYKIDTNATPATVIWDTAAAISGNLTGSAAVDNFTAGINSCWIGSEGGSLYNINTGDGTVHSFFATGGAIKSSPFIDAAYTGYTNNLFIASFSGKLYCKSSGNLTTYPWATDNFNPGNSPINTVPFVDLMASPKMVYFGTGVAGTICTNDNKLYQVNAENGTQAGCWTFTAGGPINSSPIVYNNTVFFGSDDGKCYALSTSNGSLKTGWPVTTGAEVKAMPVLSGWDGSNYTSITFTSQDGKVYTLQLP